MKKASLILLVHLVISILCFGQTKQKNIMLLLGSANLPTLTNRVNVALDLYHIKKIDKIIVSGGCGAHASSICEATEMKNGLVAKGIPENIIYKEENSKTTVQNYIFSRVLRDELGEQIIQENDSLFVVSDHWHAIAVAARFTKYDHVHAKFFIEGDLTPKPTDLLDYGGIFNKYADENEFVLRGTWPTPNAVFNKNGFTNYIFNDRIYLINERLADTTAKRISDQFPFLPKNWLTIDAATSDLKSKTTMYFYKQSCLIQDEKGKLTSLSLNDFITNLPTDVNYIDACFIKEDILYLFVREKVIIAKRDGKKFKIFKTEDLKSAVRNWPSAWGKGNLSAASYNVKDKTIYLYKNEQYITLNEKTHLATEPKKLEINWIAME